LKSGDAAQAGYCLRRAVELGPNLPPIWLRAMHFYMATDRIPEALAASVHVLHLVSDYDPFVFSYYDRIVPDVLTLVPLLAKDRRPLEAYQRHLIGAGESAKARTLWPSLTKAADDQLASDYVNFLLRTGAYAAAAEAWAAHVGGRRGNYLRPNLLYNGSFGSEPSPCNLDWQLAPAPDVQIDLAHGLRITFLGKENLEFHHVTQFAAVRPGHYVFEASIRTQDLTTEEGVRFRLFDAVSRARFETETNQFNGTSNWTHIRRPVQIPVGTNLLAVQVARDSSQKFDNKIAGTAWIDAVSLVPASAGIPR
jgi:hypothetical protein